MNRILNIFALAFLFIAYGCEELSFDDMYNDAHFFEQSILVENDSAEYFVNDTIWVSGEMPSSLQSMVNYEEITFNNASFLFSGELFLLYTENDSVSFLEKNFSVIVDNGELELVNVVADNEIKFQVDIRYGKPLENNQIRFAIVPKFEGIFAFKAMSNVYYGEERTDFNDMSWSNEKAPIYHFFENEQINEEIYGQVPLEVKQYFEFKFGSSFLTDKDFYFFNVTEE